MSNHLLKRTIVVIFCVSFLLGFAQQSYQQIPNNILETFQQLNNYNKENIFKQYFQNAILVEDYLPKGYSKEGNEDYTVYIQKALNAGTNIVMPAFPIMVNEKGITLKSNSKIFFPDGAEMRMKPNNTGSYQAISMQNIENIDLYFPVLKGDRKQHIGEDGEWGMGILIKNGKNIKIINPKISEFWGDGIYIGATDNNNSENIIIANGLLDYNRRNAISIISGKNITIENSLLANTMGTPPCFGIDMEPNNNHNTLDNIVLKNNSTYNNEVGIGVVLDMLIGENIKNINISVNNHKDYKSNESGIEFFVDRGYSKLSNSNLRGNITINRLETFDSQNAVKLNKSKAVLNLKILGKNINVTSNRSFHKYSKILDNAVNRGQEVIVK